MGGSINVVKRGSDNKVIAFKMHTSDFENLINVPQVNNEHSFDIIVNTNNLLKDVHLEEEQNENYYHDHAPLKGVNAPCEYGIALFDYYKKKILVCNNYNAFLKPTYSNMLREYRSLVKANFIMKTVDIQGNLLSKQNTLLEKHEFAMNLFLVYQGLSIGDLYYHGKTYSGMDLTGFIEKTLSINIRNKKADEVLKIIKERLQDRDNFKKINAKVIFDNYNNIEIKLPDMKIFLNDAKESIDKVYQYIKEEGFELSVYEEQRWMAEIKEVTERNKIDMP